MELMTVGTLAKRAKVSIRTLQYYDKMGLLKPSQISEGGRRMYSVQDMTILHQIITFKNLGLSLNEIKQRLIPIHTNEDIKKMLIKQAELIKAQIQKANHVIESIQMIASEIDTEQAVNWSKYSNMLQLIQENNESFWVMNYLDHELLDNIVQVHGHYSEQELPSDWLVKSLKQAKALMDSGATPESSEAQALAADMWAIVERYTQGQPEMIQRLYVFFKDAAQWPSQYAEMQKSTHEFLEASIEYHLRRQR